MLQTQCQFVVGRQRELDDLSEFVAESAEMTEDTSNTQLHEGLLTLSITLVFAIDYISVSQWLERQSMTGKLSLPCAMTCS